jgi:mannitol-specific phosphotransferase system IIBC component
VELKHLIAFEKWTCLLAVIVLAFGLLFLPRHAALSLSLGAGMMALNAWAIRHISERYGLALRARPGFAMLLLNIKMGVIIALCWCLIRYAHIDPLAFVIGISVLPVAIVIVGLSHGLRRPEDTNG